MARVVQAAGLLKMAMKKPETELLANKAIATSAQCKRLADA